jgi:hypothetical protein
MVSKAIFPEGVNMERRIWIGFVVGVFALPAICYAHNSGHIFRPDGTCLEIGSFREAPLVGKDRSQLDLVPETPNPPRDEYGVSFVGYQSLFGGLLTPIIPGPCPAGSPMTAPAAPAVTASGSQTVQVNAPADDGSEQTSKRGLNLSFGAKKDD